MELNEKIKGILNSSKGEEVILFRSFFPLSLILGDFFFIKIKLLEIRSPGSKAKLLLLIRCQTGNGFLVAEPRRQNFLLTHEGFLVNIVHK